jgi:diguanylate cyclase (GGDEF)-like protein
MPSATEATLFSVVCLQAVLALGWWLAGALMPASRREALYWGGYALLFGLALMLFMAASALADERLRAAGVCVVMVAMMALQRGVWAFFAKPAGWRWHGALAGATLLASVLAASGASRELRIALVSALVAVANLSVAWDIWRLSRTTLRRRWVYVLVAPTAVAALVFAQRGLRAWLLPDSVLELSADTSRNLAYAYGYLALTLCFHLSLLAMLLSRLVVQLRRSSRRDALTGVLNRGALDEALADEAQRARRLAEPFVVMMIDADHFKTINDRHGHAAGDHALQHLAALLSTQARDIDRIGRYGGEEFTLLLPGASLAEAALVAERLRERVTALPLMWHGTPLALTVSIGLAAWQGDDDTLPTLLQRADSALYRAKANGRNRVEVSEAYRAASAGALSLLATRPQ